MSSAAAVLVCVLGVLGRSAGSMPPIELVDGVPPGVSASAEAFVWHDKGTIYLITTSPIFRDAVKALPSCEGTAPPKKIASILVHEEWHIRHGSDERGAYQMQLTTLSRLGLGPDSAVYYGVLRSMQKVLSEQRRSRKPDLLLAKQ